MCVHTLGDFYTILEIRSHVVSGMNRDSRKYSAINYNFGTDYQVP